jgi:hypothetical protein
MRQWPQISLNSTVLWGHACIALRGPSVRAWSWIGRLLAGDRIGLRSRVCTAPVTPDPVWSPRVYRTRGAATGRRSPHQPPCARAREEHSGQLETCNVDARGLYRSVRRTPKKTYPSLYRGAERAPGLGNMTPTTPPCEFIRSAGLESPQDCSDKSAGVLAVCLSSGPQDFQE